MQQYIAALDEYERTSSRVLSSKCRLHNLADTDVYVGGLADSVSVSESISADAVALE